MQDIPLMDYPRTSTEPTRDSSPLLEQAQAARALSPTTPSSKSYRFAPNSVSNAKYNLLTFVPVILYEQFKFFFNLYFLLVALSQIAPQLRIGYLSSYVVPLAFVLTVTMGKEAYDDLLRRKRDSVCNFEQYKLSNGVAIRAQDLRVGHIVHLKQNQRVPADMVVLKTSEPNGECFIRTDQLDGETDWKLRVACPLSQHLPETDTHELKLSVAEPEKSISTFFGTIEHPPSRQSAPLGLDNSVFANCVLATGSIDGIVVYTGKDTRMAMNTSSSRNKVGLLELEVNSISKVLCLLVLVLSVVLVCLHGLSNTWYINILRFLILFSTIIPVSLRVNLDMAKTVYASQIANDTSIPETLVRTSTIPEELGRVDYLLTDKTGTITQNEMDLRKVHVGAMAYSADSHDEIAKLIAAWDPVSDNQPGTTRAQREVASRVCDLALTLALCHSVTPTEEGGFQAVSPDEIAIVTWTASIGLELIKRDRRSLTLRHTASRALLTYDILHIFPFTSESKRMGLVLADEKRRHWFLEKGADTVMMPIVKKNDWAEEEVANMAREGLRTLVVGRKQLDESDYSAFNKAYKHATLKMVDRDASIAQVVADHLEQDLDLLGITGVEDKLQIDVKPSFELMRNAGIKIWMLTGDKVETAKCVAISSRLVARGQYIHTVTKLDSLNLAHQHLDYLSQMPDACLLLDGQSLQFFRDNLADFGEIVLKLPVVVACRCSPQQKADLTKMVKTLTGLRTCAIGDGGNDVSMIQAADVGVGIVGKEGRQASLAADFSITQFCYLTKLLLWHGRNSYKRSAKLAQFVIHRGLLISVCQAVYSISSKFEPLALHQGFLMVGYATIYTMAPVFSLVTDHDVDENLARMYPELYKELKSGRSLSYRSFFTWTLVSLYQGVIIQGFSQLFVGLSTQVDSPLFKRMVSVSYSALILNELLMVAIEIVTWNKAMVLSEVVTLLVYVGSVPFLGDYFDLEYLGTISFYWKTAAILAISVVPTYLAKIINRRLKPPTYSKVQV